MPDVNVAPMPPRIFVQIASYRDPECYATICDLLLKAKEPTRIAIGVCLQVVPEEDTDCLLNELPRNGQIRVKEFDARDSRGAVWARVEAGRLWRGEEFVLHIHAHQRFEQGWDASFLRAIERLPDRSLLTAWMPAYLPPDKKQPLGNLLPLATVKGIGGWPLNTQIVDLAARLVRVQEIANRRLPTYCWPANLLFGPSQAFQRVPFDPHIYFYGEEINYTTRLWTSGYDLYHLNEVVLYHYWRRDLRHGSYLYANHQFVRNQETLRRNLHLLGIQTTTDRRALEELDGYPLGKERDLDAYWERSGIDLKNGSISRAACEGLW